jgi:HEAT repeat protein
MRQWLLMFLAAGILATAGAADLGAQAKKTKEQVDKLIATLKTDKDAKKRQEAAQELQRIGEIRAKDGKPATEALVEAFRKDGDGNVRVAAGNALRAIEPDPKLVLPALLEVLKNDKEGNGVLTTASLLAAVLGKEAKESAPLIAEIKKREEAKDEKARDGNLLNAVNTALQNIGK